MDFSTFFLAAYLITTIIAVSLTYAEQRTRGIVTPGSVMMGYMLCLVWPLVAAVMILFYKFMGRQVVD